MPRTEDDVVSAVRYAAENRIPVHPRGAGTDSGGGSLGPGLVIDLSRHLRRVISIEPEPRGGGAGVVLDELNAQLATFGRRLEPIPSDPDITTIGGMIAVDAAGRAVAAVWLDRRPGGAIACRVRRGRAGRPGLRTLAGIRVGAGRTQGADRPQAPHLVPAGGSPIHRACSAAPRNRAGYALARPPTSRASTSAGWSPGSEGTLAVVTQAMLRTVPLPARPGGASCCRSSGCRDAAAFVPDLLGPVDAMLVRPARSPFAPPGPRRRSALPGLRSTRRPSRSWWSSTRATTPRPSADRVAAWRSTSRVAPDRWSPAPLRPSPSGRSASGSWAGGDWSRAGC